MSPILHPPPPHTHIGHPDWHITKFDGYSLNLMFPILLSLCLGYIVIPLSDIASISSDSSFPITFLWHLFPSPLDIFILCISYFLAFFKVPGTLLSTSQMRTSDPLMFYNPDQSICIFNKFPGDTEAPGSNTTLEKNLLWIILRALIFPDQPCFSP